MSWLFLLAPLDARADPFNVWPERTPRGSIGLNPYVTVGPSSASGFVFVGAADNLDLIFAATAGLEAGEPLVGPMEVYVRAFPFPEAEVALVAHVSYTSPDDWFVGPELHAMKRPVDWFGVWLDVGWRGREQPSPGYLWTGFELTGKRPFVAFEADFELVAEGGVATTLIPSVGLWLGPEAGTGVSVGALLSPDPDVPPGLGVWLWQNLWFRRPVEPQAPYHVEEGCFGVPPGSGEPHCTEEQEPIEP